MHNCFSKYDFVYNTMQDSNVEGKPGKVKWQKIN